MEKTRKYTFVIMTSEVPISVPSGRAIALQEVITEQGEAGAIYRFRFVAREMNDHDLLQGINEIENDMNHLCEKVALPFVRMNGNEATSVIISFANQEFDFGVTSPQVVQSFSSFSIDNDTCMWEPF